MSIISRISALPQPPVGGHQTQLRQNFGDDAGADEDHYQRLRDLRQQIGRDVTVKPDTQLHHEQFDVMAV